MENEIYENTANVEILTVALVGNKFILSKIYLAPSETLKDFII